MTPLSFVALLSLGGLWLFLVYLLVDIVRDRRAPRLVRLGFGLILLGVLLLPVAALLGELKVTP